MVRAVFKIIGQRDGYARTVGRRRNQVRQSDRAPVFSPTFSPSAFLTETVPFPAGPIALTVDLLTCRNQFLIVTDRLLIVDLTVTSAVSVNSSPSTIAVAVTVTSPDDVIAEGRRYAAHVIRNRDRRGENTCDRTSLSGSQPRYPTPCRDQYCSTG